jgi:hypothetical protein
MKGLKIMSYCRITDASVILDGREVAVCNPKDEDPWLLQIYKAMDIHYPKFHKMDNLCKAGFLGAEMAVNDDTQDNKEDWAVVTFNRSSSLDDDTAYQKTIADADNYFPAPSVFVYTLPNILSGEIAIRHKIMGESAHYITKEFSAERICEAFNDLVSEGKINTIVGGWAEYFQGHVDVLMFKVSVNEEDKQLLTINNILKLWKI